MTDPLPMLADLLLPGDGRWPPASRAVPRAAIARAFAGPGLAALAGRVAAHRGAGASEAVRAFEEADPDTFRAALASLTDAYYGSAAVQPLLRELAMSGPPDPDPLFDPRSLAQVRARQAGRRRL
jgi:hypothetical protein